MKTMKTPPLLPLIAALLFPAVLHAQTKSHESNGNKSGSGAAATRPAAVYVPLPPPTPEQIALDAEVERRMAEMQDTYRRFVEQTSIQNFKMPAPLEKTSPVEKLLTKYVEKTNPQEFGRGSNLAGQQSGVETKGAVAGVHLYGGTSTVYTGGNSVDGTGTVLTPGSNRGSTQETKVEVGVQVRLPDSTAAPVPTMRHPAPTPKMTPAQNAVQGADAAMEGILIDPAKKSSQDTTVPQK